MSDPKSEGAALIKFNFHGDNLDVVTTPDGHFVVLARLCEPFGVRVDGQVEKLSKTPWARLQKIWVRDSRGQEQEVMCLDIESVSGWLFSLNRGKVAEHLREKLDVYQKECAKALADHFLGRRGSHMDRVHVSVSIGADQIAAIAAATAAATVQSTVEAVRLVLREERAAWIAAPAQPAGIIGTSGAREIKAKLKEYGSLMAPGNKKQARSWHGQAETELRARLGFNGAGRRWDDLPFHMIAQVRALLEEMLRRAGKLAAERNQVTMPQVSP